jgi:hypothetical protein
MHQVALLDIVESSPILLAAWVRAGYLMRRYLHADRILWALTLCSPASLRLRIFFTVLANTAFT